MKHRPVRALAGQLGMEWYQAWRDQLRASSELSLAGWRQSRECDVLTASASLVCERGG